ncbi:hypothetical protein RHS03_05121, partial [Rhizoctonia solani]
MFVKLVVYLASWPSLTDFSFFIFTQLWSVVTLSDNPPFNFSRLCLDRSGTTTSLDIEIDMSNRFWNHQEPESEVYTNATIDALNFIVVHGGTPSRWRTFWFHMPWKVRGMEPQIAVLNFISESPMPKLERFEVKYDGAHHRKIEERWGKLLSNKPLFQHPPPARLKVAVLEWVPNPYLFAGSLAGRPQIVGLTRLEVKFPPKLPKLEDFGALLVNSPMLEVLSIDTRINQCSHRSPNQGGQNLPTSLPRISLPKVRVLGLSFNTSHVFPWWGHSLLFMLNAPNVQSLRLLLESPGCRGRVPVNQTFIDYIIKGDDQTKPKPLFPLLTNLELFVEPIVERSGRRYPNQEILKAYPSITTLILPRPTELHMLSIQPWLVPCLNRLIVYARLASELRESISERCVADLGLKTVEVLVLDESNNEEIESKYIGELYGLGLEISFSHSKHRVREVLGLDDI